MWCDFFAIFDFNVFFLIASGLVSLCFLSSCYLHERQIENDVFSKYLTQIPIEISNENDNNTYKSHSAYLFILLCFYCIVWIVFYITISIDYIGVFESWDKSTTLTFSVFFLRKKYW